MSLTNLTCRSLRDPARLSTLRECPHRQASPAAARCLPLFVRKLRFRSSPGIFDRHPPPWDGAGSEGDVVSHVDLLPSRSTHRPRDGRGGHTELPGDLGQREPERGDELRDQGVPGTPYLFRRDAPPASTWGSDQRGRHSHLPPSGPGQQASAVVPGRREGPR